MSTIALAVGFIVVLIFLLLILGRVYRSKDAGSQVEQRFVREADRLDRSIRDETSRLRSELGSALAGLLEGRLSSLNSDLAGTLSGLREELDRQRNTLSDALGKNAETVAGRVGQAVDRNDNSFTAFGQQLGQFESKLDARVETLRHAVETQLGKIQEDNAARLSEMRATVEEKLQSALDRRLSESFNLVSQQLEQVHRALGEMQSLSEHVGDLRRVMSNVRARGALGEWRLDALLQEMLTQEQFARNVKPVPDSNAIVEFAIRMPRHGNTSGEVWLPVDSKFPTEAYERVLAAQDAGDRDALETAQRELAGAIRVAATDIRTKYISPPHTTEYAILFLPTESLFAEVVRLPGIIEEIQRDFRVTIAGPTTLATLLNALQMGFRTVALEQRANEVWNVLGAVRTEFEKYGQAMAAVKRKLELATKEVEKVEIRQRAMGRKLRAVEELPAAESERVLALPSGRAETDANTVEFEDEFADEADDIATVSVGGES